MFPCCKGSPPPAETALVLPEQEPLKRFLYTPPEEGKLVFLGVAGIRSRREESLKLALEEAARRVVLFHALEGEFTVYSYRGSRFLDYQSETKTSLNFPDTYADYVEDLEFNEESDVFLNENALFVRVRYPGVLDLNYQPSYTGPGAKPVWIDTPPGTISGYTVGVGYAARRNAHRDTVIASYENAVFSIIKNISGTAGGAISDFRGSGFFDIASAGSDTLFAKGALKGFYVLETWVDSASLDVWTLAVAREDLDLTTGTGVPAG
jgi:hypothetical protein